MSVRTFQNGWHVQAQSENLIFHPRARSPIITWKICVTTREILKLIFLNTRCRLIGECNVSEGTIDSALVSPRELFIEAFKRNAYGIILLHNHPGGDPTPSREDVMITRRIYEAGELLGIRLFDHIVIGDNCFVSMKEKGFFGK